MQQEHAAEGHAAASAHAESPLEHIVQHPLIERPADLGPLTPNGVITIFSDQIAMIVLAGVLLIAFVPIMIRRRRGRGDVDGLVPAGGANMLEAVCQYIRKEVAELKARGVEFEDYDLPGKDAEGIVTQGGAMAAWFKDSEGNIMAVIQTL